MWTAASFTEVFIHSSGSLKALWRLISLANFEDETKNYILYHCSKDSFEYNVQVILECFIFLCYLFLTNNFLVKNKNYRNIKIQVGIQCAVQLSVEVEKDTELMESGERDDAPGQWPVV